MRAPEHRSKYSGERIYCAFTFLCSFVLLYRPGLQVSVVYIALYLNDCTNQYNHISLILGAKNTITTT